MDFRQWQTGLVLVHFNTNSNKQRHQYLGIEYPQITAALVRAKLVRIWSWWRNWHFWHAAAAYETVLVPNSLSNAALFIVLTHLVMEVQQRDRFNGIWSNFVIVWWWITLSPWQIENCGICLFCMPPCYLKRLCFSTYHPCLSHSGQWEWSAKHWQAAKWNSARFWPESCTSCYSQSDDRRTLKLIGALLSDEPREAGLRELQVTYYPIPDKKSIGTTMGHVEICIVLKRSHRDDVEDDQNTVFEFTDEYVAVKVNLVRTEIYMNWQPFDGELAHVWTAGAV